MSYPYDPYEPERQEASPYYPPNGQQYPYYPPQGGQNPAQGYGQNFPPMDWQPSQNEWQPPQGGGELYPQYGQGSGSQFFPQENPQPYPPEYSQPYLTQPFPGQPPQPQEEQGIRPPQIPEAQREEKPVSKPVRRPEPVLSRLALSAYGWLEALISAMVIVIVIFTFFFRSVAVEGPSMNPTLQNKDRLIVTSMFYQPRRGDIVVIKPTEKMPEKALIKRVIGLPGDHIEINEGTGGHVRINGEMFEPENYIREPITLSAGEAYDLTVPEGAVFVLGDNRNNSIDSRRSEVDMVDERYLMGKALFRVAPNLAYFNPPNYTIGGK